MLRRRTRVRSGVLLITVMLLLTGCSKGRFVSVRYVPGESLEFFVPLCGDERLRELWLEDIGGTPDQDDDRVLWRLEAANGARSVTRLEFGAEPSGFNGQGLTSLNELEARYRERELAVHAATDKGNPLGLFTLDELPTDGSAVLQGSSDRVVSVAELKEAQRAGTFGGLVIIMLNTWMVHRQVLEASVKGGRLEWRAVFGGRGTLEVSRIVRVKDLVFFRGWCRVDGMNRERSPWFWAEDFRPMREALENLLGRTL